MKGWHGQFCCCCFLGFFCFVLFLFCGVFLVAQDFFVRDGNFSSFFSLFNSLNQSVCHHIFLTLGPLQPCEVSEAFLDLVKQISVPWSCPQPLILLVLCPFAQSSWLWFWMPKVFTWPPLPRFLTPSLHSKMNPLFI